jgi:hypothetical protein
MKLSVKRAFYCAHAITFLIRDDFAKFVHGGKNGNLFVLTTIGSILNYCN